MDEPPDPDDFESLNAFREQLARWDCEHNEVSPSDNEPLFDSLWQSISDEFRQSPQTIKLSALLSDYLALASPVFNYSVEPATSERNINIEDYFNSPKCDESDNCDENLDREF